MYPQVYEVGQYFPTTPVASFTANVTSGSAPLPVLFTDTSTESPTSWKWGAKNVTGNDSWIPIGTTQNQEFTFPVGNWSVNVTATNGAGSNISTQITHVNVSSGVNPPVASFTPTSASGVSPYGVAFTDTSTNTPTYWNWTVEGKIGNTTKYLNVSTSQNPTFTFLEGNYTISLGAGNDDGFDMADQETWVNVSSGAPVVSFTTNVTSGVNDLALYLNDTSTLSPTYWNTSWGDNPNSWTNQTTFPVTNITHVYSTAGEYYINQYATNPYGTANGTPLLITVYGYANSQFAVFNTLGGAPFTTYLYDTSTNTTPGATSYYWDFGDGNTSTEQNVYYTWNITGTYSVNHSFSNGLSTSWNNKSDYVVVGTSVTKPAAAFNGTPSLGANPLTEFFTDVSANTPTEWYWMFGDGTTSTDQNPSHTYTKSGFFTVNFSATNVAGTDWMNRTNFVMVY
jgi:PKD repeat protein